MEAGTQTETDLQVALQSHFWMSVFVIFGLPMV
jgi:hypothetical protein